MFTPSLGLRGHGMGADCPAFAPYLDRNGACSNIPAGVTDAHEFFQSPYTSPDSLPSGYFMNPETGVVERLAVLPGSSYQEIISTPGAAEASAAAADAEGAEAMRQGRARGLDIQCVTRANCGPSAVGGNPGPVQCLYWSECTVNGDPGHDAGLLIRPGGLEIAATEISAQPLDMIPVLGPSGQAVGYQPIVGQPVSNTYAAPYVVRPAAPAPGPAPSSSQAAATTATNRPNQSVPPKDTTIAMANGVTNPAARILAGAQEMLQPLEESTGMSSTVLLIGAAVAAFFLLKGGR